MGKYLLAGCCLVALVTGCHHDSGVAIKPVPTGSSPTVEATDPVPTEQQTVLAQYRTFWASLTAVSKMPAGQRRAALQPYTTDPELKSLLAGMLATDRKGQVFYGADRPRATQASLSPDGARAVVNDCQDSRNSGVARRSDQAPLTKGVARNHVVVTMKKLDGAWKVYFVSYTKTPC